MDDKEAIRLIKEKFGGREIDPNEPTTPTPRRRTANEDSAVPLMKMYRCQDSLPGCGLSKPANEFYKEFNTICSACALNLVRKHNTDLYWVPLILNCYELARKVRAECERLATPEGIEAARKTLVVNKEIEVGRGHLIDSMIAGTKKDAMATEWVTDLYDRFRKWMLKHYGIENTANKEKERQ